jgi:hypothetical protein
MAVSPPCSYDELLASAAPSPVVVSDNAMKALSEYMKELLVGLKGGRESVLIMPEHSQKIKKSELNKVLSDLSKRFGVKNPYYDVVHVEEPARGWFRGDWQWKVVFFKQTTQTYVSGKPAGVSSAPRNCGWGGY